MKLAPGCESFPAQTFLIQCRVLYMCGVDHLLPCSVYRAVKPGGRRPTWAHSVAPYSHQRGTHFIKNDNNNVTRAQNASFTAVLLIKFLLFYSLHWQPERLIHTKPKLSSAFFFFFQSSAIENRPQTKLTPTVKSILTPNRLKESLNAARWRLSGACK